jgi:putative ABC transport system substrate-binding protein
VTAALQRESRTIPIVFTVVADPIGSGFIASLPQPGGNMTGVSQYEASVTGKWLAMLKATRSGPVIWRQTFVFRRQHCAWAAVITRLERPAASAGLAII